MTEKNILRLKYVLADTISFTMSYCIVFFVLLEKHISLFSLLFVYLIHISVYILSGYYNKPFAKSRIKELITTVCSVPLAMVVSYLFLYTYDIVCNLGKYVPIALFPGTFLFTYMLRLMITQMEIIKDRKGLRTTNIFVISNGVIGERTKKWIRQYKNKKIVGEADFNNSISEIISLYESANEQNKIEELVIASNSNSLDKLNGIIYHFIRYRINIYTSAKGFAKIAMRNKIDTLFGEPLTEVTKINISEAGKNIKWLSDKIISFSLLVIISPLFLILALIVKLDSDGEIFFSQERIGLNGKPFTMYKFRSMYIGSEGNKPQLSHKGDKRITRSGRWMRRYRLDELPQLYNVLKGDMSIVGPRPEREFYINELVRHCPHYRLLQNIKPGITSWGIVRYGYASNIKEMIERFDYDWIYYQNISIVLDITVMLYTIRTLIFGLGK